MTALIKTLQVILALSILIIVHEFGHFIFAKIFGIRVVVVDGDYEWFIPVNVLDKRDNMVYIAAIQQGVLAEGQTVRLF